MPTFPATFPAADPGRIRGGCTAAGCVRSPRFERVRPEGVGPADGGRTLPIGGEEPAETGADAEVGEVTSRARSSAIDGVPRYAWAVADAERIPDGGPLPPPPTPTPALAPPYPSVLERFIIGCPPALGGPLTERDAIDGDAVVARGGGGGVGVAPPLSPAFLFTQRFNSLS